MRIFILLIMTLILMTGVSEAVYMNNTKIGLDNGAYITVMTTNFTNFTKYGIEDDPSSTLQYYINGSRIRYTTLANKTITSPYFNVVTDNFSVNVSGLSGYINFSVVMNNATDQYNFTSNSVFVESANSTIDRLVYFNYTGSYPSTFVVHFSKSLGQDIEGWVTNILEFYLEGARIDINGYRTFTDENGYYTIKALNPGNYTLLVRQIDYINNTQIITINGNFTTTNVTLLEIPFPVVKVSGFGSILSIFAVLSLFMINKKL